MGGFTSAHFDITAFVTDQKTYSLIMESGDGGVKSDKLMKQG